jgi:prepilin-type N-terminal cleavage/methylation domain-containing protein
LCRIADIAIKVATFMVKRPALNQFSVLACFSPEERNKRLKLGRLRVAQPVLTKSSSGFSLIELVVALAVVAFCLLPILGLMALSSQQGQSSEQTTDLTLILQSQQAVLGAESFDTLKTQISTTPSLVYYYATGGRCLNYVGQSPATAAPTSAFYKCTVQQSTAQVAAATALATQESASGVNPSSDDRICGILTIQYPAPGYALQKTFPLSFFRYGSR